MRLRTVLVLLWLSLPVLATGALYQVKDGRLQRAEAGFTVDVRYPRVSGLGAAVDEAFNAESKRRAEQMAAEFEKHAREMLKEAPQAPGTQAQYLNADFQTKHLSDRLLALLISGAEYTGGAHPNPFFYTLLVDPKTGHKVPVSQLFESGCDYLALLRKLSLQDLKPRLEELNTDADWVSKGTEARQENFQLLWPGEEGLHLLFSPYQVAPYSSGAIEIVIPYEKLHGVLSDRFFAN
jgi:hypothetical protein